MNDPTVRFNAALHHLGVIMDGNGRWAQQRGLPRSAGHQAGVQALKRLVSFAGEYNIRIITAFAFSTENWHRPSSEVNFLMRLLAETIAKEIDELAEKGVHLRFIGRLHELPKDLIRTLDGAMARTAANDQLVLNVALNYGGRAEIVDAVRKIADLVQRGQLALDDIGEELVARQMTTEGLPDPDLIIRTGGEHRLSNFLLWQSAYAELWVTSTYWPDFDRRELVRALMAYQVRKRRFGRIHEI
ncbi:MAG: isoprenyl transferase [Firmicutes bacterium]|jgi:undecaprenyl diphosphate synthase|nr:isoprenyl transferase [Bacillota bacterium]